MNLFESLFCFLEHNRSGYRRGRTFSSRSWRLVMLHIHNQSWNVGAAVALQPIKKNAWLSNPTNMVLFNHQIFFDVHFTLWCSPTEIHHFSLLGAWGDCIPMQDPTPVVLISAPSPILGDWRPWRQAFRWNNYVSSNEWTVEGEIQ